MQPTSQKSPPQISPEQTCGQEDSRVRIFRSLAASEGLTPEQLLERVLDGFDVEITDRMPCSFTCNCSKERVEKALISIGKKELQEMIDEGKSIEVNCQFCNKHYEFSVDELKKLYEKAKK